MLDVSILILIFIFGLYAGFISKYNIAHHLTIKIIMIIGIIILQFIRDKYANIYTIALGTMLVIPYSSKLKEYFEDTEDKGETKKDKGDKEDKEEPKNKKKKKKKAKDDDEDDEDDKKSGGLLGKKRRKTMMKMKKMKMVKKRKRRRRKKRSPLYRKFRQSVLIKKLRY